MQTQTLDRETIALSIERNQIGNYWLGIFEPDGSFIVRYVGRSDTCLRRRLMEHSSKELYEAFIVRPAESIREAFDIECREWHMMGSSLDNQIHPDAPRHLTHYTCPYCKIFTSSNQTDEESVGGEA